MTRTRAAATTKVQQAVELLDADAQQRVKDKVVLAVFRIREMQNMSLESARDVLASLGIRFNSVQALVKFHRNAERRMN